MIRTYFEKELIEIASDLERIWGLVLGQFEVIIGLATNNQLKEVIDNDLSINDAVIHLDKKCQILIGLQQPVNDDLRRIVTVMKISTDLERIGDRIVEIAKTMQNLEIPEVLSVVDKEIQKYKLTVHDELEKTLFSYRNLRCEEISSIKSKIRLIGEASDSLEEKVLSSISKEEIVAGRDFLFILHNLNKISNLILSIYKWMSFQKIGKIS